MSEELLEHYKKRNEKLETMKKDIRKVLDGFLESESYDWEHFKDGLNKIHEILEETDH